MVARSINKLSDTALKAAKEPGRYSDGGGLYLNVSAAGSKSWVFMWSPAGSKRREMGLGSFPAVKLKDAREKAVHCRATVAAGGDPIAEKDKEAEPTFGECADMLVASIKSSWRNAKHEYQWTQTLTQYCAGIRGKRVSQISTEDVLSVLTPIWATKNETASRLRGRIERVLDFAKVKGWRSGENPAVWRGHLRNILPGRQKLQRGHLAAMPYDSVPAFVSRLRTHDATAARALEFLILTAGRSNEVLGARWSEIDFDRATWTIPPERMKLGLQHVVPLSDRAVELLRSMNAEFGLTFIFPGVVPPKGKPMPKGRPLSAMAMEMLLRRMKVTDATVHGFRSAFRDWTGDETSFPREVAEAALAHRVGNEVERAYRRSDALGKRRHLMQAWAAFLESQPLDNVILMKGRP